MLHVKNKLEIWQESCFYNIKNLTIWKDSVKNWLSRSIPIYQTSRSTYNKDINEVAWTYQEVHVPVDNTEKYLLW